MTRDIFGTAPDGSAVERVTISNGALTASIMTWGATIQDLHLEGHDHPLVLGFENFAGYLVHSPYFGIVAGRCANRIRNGRFTIDGIAYEIDRNSHGHHLHGGAHGTGERNWRIERHDHRSATLTLTDPAGEMGYPGTCRLSATYEIRDPATLSLVLEAETDAPTLVNLAPHSYFNLDGSETIDAHELRIDAARYLPVDKDFLPTGEIRPVEGTRFDFRTARPVRQSKMAYDHNFCLSDKRVAKRDVAWLRSPSSGIEMTLATTEPGLQLYDGAKLGVAVPGLNGRRYGRFAGLCLEPQVWPDAINRTQFPSPILRPGERYRHETEYRFSVPGL